MILRSKVIVATGASEGIGLEIAKRLAKEGAKLALVARSGEKLQEIAAQMGNAEVFSCDIRNKADIKKTVEAIVTKFGGLDVLVNCAGIWQKVAQLDDISNEVVDDVIATNLTGTIYMTKYALPYLKKKNEETAILNIISKSGIVAQEGQSIYTASKYGLKGFTDVLRVDLQDTKIRIGAVYQSGTNTEMFRKTGEDFSQDKFTDPSDLADAVAYMLTRPPKMWIPELQVVF